MTKILTLFLSALIFCFESSLPRINGICAVAWNMRWPIIFPLNRLISIPGLPNCTYDQAKGKSDGNSSMQQPALGLNFGRSINQTTNIYTNTSGFVPDIIICRLDITLFNWFALKRATESNKFSYDAQVVNIDKIKNDVTLNVAAAYLSALLSKEQVTLAKTKLQLNPTTA